MGHFTLILNAGKLYTTSIRSIVHVLEAMKTVGVALTRERVIFLTDH